jgi:hypothetical protein
MSGMLGLDPATRVLVAGGPYAEAKQVRKMFSASSCFETLRLWQLFSCNAQFCF